MSCKSKSKKSTKDIYKTLNLNEKNPNKVFSDFYKKLNLFSSKNKKSLNSTRLQDQSRKY